MGLAQFGPGTSGHRSHWSQYTGTMPGDTKQSDAKEAGEIELLAPGQEKENTKEEGEDGIKLKAEMTLMNGCTVIIGCIIGSGIFVSPTGVLQCTGSVNLSIVVWIICGLFTMIGNNIKYFL